MHIVKDHITVIKSTISSVNLTIQRINKNENIIMNNVKKLIDYLNEGMEKIEDRCQILNELNTYNFCLLRNRGMSTFI